MRAPQQAPDLDAAPRRRAQQPGHRNGPGTARQLTGIPAPAGEQQQITAPHLAYAGHQRGEVRRPVD
jgi:hypothetical protein